MTHLQRLGIALAVALSAASILFAARCDESVPFLVRDAEAPWIGPPIAIDTNLRRVAPGQRWGAHFERHFELGEAQSATLEARALGTLELFLDDRPIAHSVAAGRLARGATPDARCLKRHCTARFDVPAGAHELRVRVVNERGPPLLSLALELGETRVDTGHGFRVRSGATGMPFAAVAADDTRRLPNTLQATRPAQALAALWPWLLGLALLGALAPYALRALGASGWPRRSVERAALLAIAALWLWIFFARFAQLPLETGFDSFGHLEYVQYIADRAELPARDHGWSTYHPPAFYALAAIPVRLVGGNRYTGDPHDGVRERLAMRAIPWLFALGTAWIVWRAARLVFPEDPRIANTAGLFAALLPLQITLAGYVSNEGTHAFFASAALLAAGHAMLARDAQRERRALVATALALGAALLSKFTGLLVAAVVCAFIAFERWQARGVPLLRALGPALAVGAGAFAVGGWFYVENALRYGDPVVWNLDFPGGESWWVHPAFHTSRYFTQAGDALVHPFFSSFASFWDGLYTTLWGDGQLGGFTNWQARPAVWDWQWMAAGYALALPLTAMIAAGAVLIVRDSLRGPELGRRALLAMFATLGFGLSVAVVSATLRYPFFGTPRASYALAVLVPLSLAAARGLVATHDALAARGAAAPFLTGALRAWLACAVGSVLFTYAF